MDKIDREILAALQDDARATITELADRVRLSISRCQRRLRELERSGVIRGYRPVLEPAALGLGFEVLVFVTLQKEDGSTIGTFDTAVQKIPNVVQAQRLFGETDYMLRVLTADLTSYQLLLEQELSLLPGLERMVSTIVMKDIVRDRPLPT